MKTFVHQKIKMLQSLKTCGTPGVCNELEKDVMSLMNKELLKLIEIPLAQPSIVLPLPCHVMYMSLC